jgi:flagellar protein FlgJ
VSSVNQIGMAGIISLTKPIPRSGDPTKIHAAAQQFEAVLLTQILHAAHDKDSGWMGSGGDSSSDCATDYAEQQLASTMAQQGGLGLAKLITAGLNRESSVRSR